jgi:hypothetical protein
MSAERERDRSRSGERPGGRSRAADQLKGRGGQWQIPSRWLGTASRNLTPVTGAASGRPSHRTPLRTSSPLNAVWKGPRPWLRQPRAGSALSPMPMGRFGARRKRQHGHPGDHLGGHSDRGPARSPGHHSCVRATGQPASRMGGGGRGGQGQGRPSLLRPHDPARSDRRGPGWHLLSLIPPPLPRESRARSPALAPGAVKHQVKAGPEMVRSVCGVPSLDGPADLAGSLIVHIGNAARPAAWRTSDPARARPDAAVRSPAVRGRCRWPGLLKSWERGARPWQERRH